VGVRSADRTGETSLFALLICSGYKSLSDRFKLSSHGNKTLKEILLYLKTHGERLDTEIAEAVGLSLATVRNHLAELAAKREIMVCHSIRFDNGKKVEGIKCRLAGFIPPAAPGRKSKSQLKLS
jgi:DNA-binding CsgD family transcriptional regulator